MSSKKKIMIGVSVLLIVIIVAIVGIMLLGKKEVTDAMKFKEEYESLNGTIRKSDGHLYNDIKVSEVNPIKYVNAKEVVEKLKNENAIVYFGANWCPYCRNAVPVLLEVARARNIDTIYYIYLDNDKSMWEIKDGELVKTKDGTEDYYNLLDYLKDNLRDYVLTDEEGKEYETHEKRIYLPFVVGAKDGNIVGTASTVKLEDGQSKYDPLTEEQHDKLYKIYNELVDKVFDDGTCDEECN